MKAFLVCVFVALGAASAFTQEPEPPLYRPAPRPPLPGPEEDPPNPADWAPPPLPEGPLPYMAGGYPAYFRPLDIDLQTIRYPFRNIVTVLEPGASPRGALRVPITDDTAVEVGGVVRGFLWNDQRIVWSGLEATFGAESALRVAAATRDGDWVLGSEAEIFLNQRWGTSILSDPDRDLYRTNFDVDTFQLIQMYVEAGVGPWSLRIGRSRTPFGRYQSPIFTNTFADAQFLRTDVIGTTRLGGFLETGIFFRYQPGLFVADLAIVNGEPDLDTNSSKALVTRFGLDGDWWTVGLSAKYQDGVGSEYQKRYNNLLGLDASVAVGPFLFYTECVYDQHGLHRDPTSDPFYDPYELGIRSLYGRDVHSGTEDEPITGRGGYVGVTYRETRWILDVSFGLYQPKKIGDPYHDDPTARLLIKTAYQVADHVQFYISGLAENRRSQVGVLDNQQPYAFFTGIQAGY